ncbi:MAG: hypothetical protein GX786_05520 [Clostridiales bacterium]|nr:hypothetical protein [Clostridiales bacterium]
MRKILQGSILVVIAYLVQGNILPHFDVFSVTPNLFISVIAISAVAYTKVLAFGVSALIGILVESMLPTLPMLNVIFYPAFGFLASILFGDKSERRREEEIAAGKKGNNLSPHLRTILASVFLSTVFETVHLTYIYLAGAEMTAVLFLKGFWSIAYTLILTLVIMIPLRYALGMYAAFKEKHFKNRKEKKENVIQDSEFL